MQPCIKHRYIKGFDLFFVLPDTCHEAKGSTSSMLHCLSERHSGSGAAGAICPREKEKRGTERRQKGKLQPAAPPW